VDIDEHSDWASQHSVHSIPTFILLSSAGEELARVSGYQMPEPFITWLEAGLRQAQSVALRQQQAIQQLAQINERLDKVPTVARAKVLAELLDLWAGESQAVRDLANTSLTALAKNQPSLMLEGLNHPRLAVRIQVSNRLRAQLGDAFDIDPWSDPLTRKKAVDQYRQELVEKP
jgi:thioredoxin-like negative regulator of GroEL